MRALSRRQRGATLITAALFLLFLLGFMGIALDFGRLFIVKTELQTAMDSCALAAAQELDGTDQGLTRAISAGVTAGNLNRVHFQQEAVGLTPDEVEFSDSLGGTYSNTFSPATNARYVRCQHTRNGIAPWLLQAMTGFMGNDVYANPKTVMALAVATRAPSQTTCMIPVGICQKSGASPTSPLYGFTRGDWIEGITNDSEEVETGQFRWLDFSANGGGAKEIKDQLTGEGQCALPGDETKVDVAKKGKTNGAVAAWNTRFGIYKGGTYDAEGATPDMTGYSWYTESSPPPSDMPGRYDDTSIRGFQHHRNLNSPYQGDNKADNSGLKVQGNASSTETHSAGSNRRVVATPVVNCDSPTMKIHGYACVLLLHPLPTNASGKTSKMWLEFISDATTLADNPCGSIGLPGGTKTIRVPALVQ